MTAKRPNSKRNLDMAIRRLGTGDTDFVRKRTIIANAIVGQMMPDGVVKGGSALKVRFGDVATRATTDLDAARKDELQTFLDDFSEALAEGWSGFTGRIVPRPPAQPDNVPAPYLMQPFDIKLGYLGIPWCTVPFELGHDEIGDADEPDMVVAKDASELLVKLGFPELDPIPVMPLHHQIAQKLHGVSEPGSKRAHDLIDLQVIVIRGKVDYALTKITCERLFRYRNTHAWPPTIVRNEGWDGLYDQQLLPEPIAQTVDEAVIWANNLIATIAAS